MFLFLPIDSSRELIVTIITRDKPLVRNKQWELSVFEAANCFKPDGMVSNNVLDFGLSLLREKYKDSNKLIIPYWYCVS